MAKEKKLVEAITSMEEDFTQWYTDVVKKAELMDYSSVKGCMIFKGTYCSCNSRGGRGTYSTDVKHLCGFL